MRNEPRRVFAYAQFMVGPEGATRDDRPFQRTVALERVEIRNYDRSRVYLEPRLKVAGEPVSAWWNVTLSIDEEGGVIRLARRYTATLEWRPGEEVQIRFWDERSVWRQSRELLRVTGTYRYARGREIEALNGTFYRNGPGDRVVRVGMKVEDLPPCPPILAELLDEADRGRR